MYIRLRTRHRAKSHSGYEPDHGGTTHKAGAALAVRTEFFASSPI